MIVKESGIILVQSAPVKYIDIGRNLTWTKMWTASVIKGWLCGVV